MSKTYGYCRISTSHQDIQRQVKNILKEYKDAIIKTEVYTGTTLERPTWKKLYENLNEGDTVIFDEISRMSRNANEGYLLYEDLYINKKVNLVFLKESMLNTENIKNTVQIAETGGEIDIILKAINQYLLILTKKQIRAAFVTAQHEVEFLHTRTKEGLALARANGKQLGHPIGKKNKDTEKKMKLKDMITKYNKDFEGQMSDRDCMCGLHIARNTFYKYKREIRNSITKNVDDEILDF